MQERLGTLRWAGVLALAACGGIDDGSALIRSTEALSCQTDTDCHEGYVCTHFLARSYCEPTGRSTAAASPPPAPSGETDAADPCAGGACEQGESEPGLAYRCALGGEEDQPQQQADAGVGSDGGGSSHVGGSSDAGREYCRHGNEDCARAACADAGKDQDCGEDGRDRDGEEDSEDRSGPNRGQH